VIRPTLPAADGVPPSVPLDFAGQKQISLASLTTINRRDVILGGEGDDVLQGGPGEDWIFGGDGKDVISGGFDRQAPDLMWGEDGNDTFQILTDRLMSTLAALARVGAAGQDTIRSTTTDQFDGGDGTDTVFFMGGDLDSQGPAQRQIVDCHKARASAQVARKLQLRTGDAVLQIQRVLSFADIPTILENIWLPAAPFKGLDIERLRAYPGPMYALFESEFGMRMVRAQEEIRAVLGDNEQCKLLQTGPYVPLLSVERVAFTYNDVPMELRHGLYRTDRHHYRNELG
jgi:hypothetical protein